MNDSTPVFLHGYSGDGAALQEFAALCFPGQHPICIDLPGFGSSPLTNTAAETDPREYLEEVWRVVTRAVPEGNIHLVGHSYGAVLAFALAAEHPERVSQVDLFNPGVKPKLPSQIGLFAAAFFGYVPGGLAVFTRVLRQGLFVDAVTRSMECKDWPEKRKRQIRTMRRKEALTYSPQMFRLSLHALRMPSALDTVHCTVPVRIVHANDDTVTQDASCLWIEQRSENAVVRTTHGGHLGLLAEPERWAAILNGIAY